MIPDNLNQWSFAIIITLALVLAFFIPMLYSIRETYFAKDKQSHDENE
jgi:hypothetical protein